MPRNNRRPVRVDTPTKDSKYQVTLTSLVLSRRITRTYRKVLHLFQCLFARRVRGSPGCTTRFTAAWVSNCCAIYKTDLCTISLLAERVSQPRMISHALFVARWSGEGQRAEHNMPAFMYTHIYIHSYIHSHMQRQR